ncbi:hypothetical protein LIER_19386 [Lithospermum erythrorhizon]|uniref:Uncharacterized protein n=1 Tax=Lithospermum erythrorhizon TaxID=34254 RepID=A0AAV3QHI2_LITER
MIINCDSIEGHNRLIRDYFAQSPVYNQRIFRRRFRMRPFRMLAYGITGGLTDPYIRIEESTSIKSMNFFAKSIIHVFAKEYLRRSNNNDITRLLAKAEELGVPEMLGSINCMHWEWKN